MPVSASKTHILISTYVIILKNVSKCHYRYLQKELTINFPSKISEIQKLCLSFTLSRLVVDQYMSWVNIKHRDWTLYNANFQNLADTNFSLLIYWSILVNIKKETVVISVEVYVNFLLMANAFFCDIRSIILLWGTFNEIWSLIWSRTKLQINGFLSFRFLFLYVNVFCSVDPCSAWNLCFNSMRVTLANLQSQNLY